MPELSINSVSVVLNGDFNPSIFQPAWFASQKLISETESEALSDLTVIQRDLVSFKLPWLEFRVIQQQLHAMTAKESHFQAAHDLILGTLRILRHTPIRQVGINIQKHYRFENEEKWNKFGHTLAPKPLWKQIMNDPGMFALSMVDKTPHKFESGQNANISVRVESSTAIKPNGICFLVNNHFECSNPGVASASNAILVLEKSFDEAVKFADKAIETIVTKYE